MTPAILLVEWADRGGDWLPPPDLLVHLSPLGEGRQLRLMPQSAQGLMVCRQLRKGL